jgi:glucosyl-3-phosphoglycerate phosphatase
MVTQGRESHKEIVNAGRWAPPETSCEDARMGLGTAPRVISSAVERFVHIEDVSGSNPLSPTSFPGRRNFGLRLPSFPTDTFMPRRWPEIFVLRHGETEWNAEGRMQGRLDSPLTEAGRAQARRQAQLLAQAGVTLASHALWTSPQGRARVTGLIVRATLTARGGTAPPMRSDPRLAEIGQGGWEGLTRAEVEARWPGSLDDADPFLVYDTAPEGEGFITLRSRVEAFLADLDRPAVLVTHGITSRFLRGVTLGMPTSALGELPGGQGVVHHIRDGVARVLG